MAKEVPANLEFPILVYMDEGRWVGVSLLTCTTSVADSPDLALAEVCSLLEHELEDAGQEAESLEDALKMVLCPADPELFRRFFFGKKQVEAETLAMSRGRLQRKDRLKMFGKPQFSPRVSSEALSF